MGGFNSRTHEGCDMPVPAVSLAPSKFQFTHPRGVRRKTPLLLSIGITSFNSRTHEGCDCSRTTGKRDRRSFNSRTHEGCDLPPTCSRSGRRRFNSRTHEGCDMSTTGRRTTALGFNSRTHEGCDTAWRVTFGQDERFQFTHPRGVRPMLLIPG